ncbi:MAG: PQQ-dependent sugar dehydrogenase, partial [Gammaproteobacteria bacterium]|nr:PQQ-dependent sugar dehydrogenase [Gammaproteobacteria bacterium]
MAGFRSTCARATRAAAWVVAAATGLASCGGGGGDGGGSTDGPFGIDARPANLTCLAPDRAGGSVTVTTIDAFPAAPAFDQPTKILQAPGDAARWFVLEKSGRIRAFSAGNPAAVTTWLDFSTVVNDSGEGGLLGMAFHPDYPAT